MPNGVNNGIKYQVGGVVPAGAGRVGNYIINPFALGPTDSTEYWNTYEVNAGSYTIYVYKGTTAGGPAIYYCANDSELIFITNQISGNTFTTVAQCETYFNSQVDRILVPGRSNVRVMIAGAFQIINSTSRTYIGRTYAWGETDLTWPVVPTSSFISNFLYVIKTQSTGKQIITSPSDLGAGQRKVARLNVDGTKDDTFSYFGLDAPQDIWVNSDDSFVTIGGFANAPLGMRLSFPDGAQDFSFVTPNFQSGATPIVIQKVGSNYYIGGQFTLGVTRTNFGVIGPSGALLGPPAGNGTNATVEALAVSSDGAFVYLGGGFTSWSGVPVSYDSTMGGIVKISTSTWTLDTTFRNNIGSGINRTGSSTITSLVLDETLGRLYVGGNFASFNGNTSDANLLALNLDGSRDTTFNANKTTPNNSIWKITPSNVFPNYLYIIGQFTDYGGNVGRDKIAVLTRDGVIVDTNVCSASVGFNQGRPYSICDLTI